MIDACAGIGSFGEAAKRAGIRVDCHIEIDPYRQRVLRKNSDALILGDMYEVKSVDPANIVAGGTPCQDLSNAGKRKGLDGEQSRLFYEWLRIIDIAQPSWVVWENVPGALSSNEGRDFATVLFQLAKRGFRLAWRVLDAQYYGVPQRRRRVFVVGHLGDGRAAEVLFEQESLPGNLNTRPVAWKENSRVIGTLTKSASGTARTGNGNELDMLAYNEYQFGDYRKENIAATLTQTQAKRYTNIAIAMNPHDGLGQRVFRESGVSGALMAQRHGTAESVFTNNLVRRLTPLECTRLQGFPDDWFDGLGLSDTKIYEMTGDSIALPVAEWIMKRIAERI